MIWYPNTSKIHSDFANDEMKTFTTIFLVCKIGENPWKPQERILRGILFSIRILEFLYFFVSDEIHKVS